MEVPADVCVTVPPITRDFEVYMEITRICSAALKGQYQKKIKGQYHGLP